VFIQLQSSVWSKLSSPVADWWCQGVLLHPPTVGPSSRSISLPELHSSFCRGYLLASFQTNSTEVRGEFVSYFGETVMFVATFNEIAGTKLTFLPAFLTIQLYLFISDCSWFITWKYEEFIVTRCCLKKTERLKLCKAQFCHDQCFISPFYLGIWFDCVCFRALHDLWWESMENDVTAGSGMC
jgi:hypothetical protein